MSEVTSIAALAASVNAIAQRAFGANGGEKPVPKTTQFGATVPFSASHIRDAEPALTAQIDNLEKTRAQYRAELEVRNQEGFDTVANVIAEETEFDVSVIKEELLELTRVLKHLKVERVKDEIASAITEKLGKLDPKKQDKALLKRFVETVLEGNEHLNGRVLNERYPDVKDSTSKSFTKLVDEIVDKLQPEVSKVTKPSGKGKK